MNLYAVLGNPIAHSLSPVIHTQFAQQTGQALNYERVLAPLDGFAHSVAELRARGALGANVTVPFKLEAHALANALSPRAIAAGAVNTLVFEGQRIFGENTDGLGLVCDIVHNAHFDLHDKRILLLGAGGAARGVLLPLLETQPAHITIANRSVARAQELASKFSVQASSFADLRGTYDLIINATSASLHGELPPLPASIVGDAMLAYDMMYGATPSVFLQWAAVQGVACRDGLGMLVEQAAAAFHLWRGVMPETASVLVNLRTKFGQNVEHP